MVEKQVTEWAYLSLKGIFRTMLKAAYTVSTQDLHKIEEIPADQGFIIAANHGSIVDAFLMGLEIDSHKVRFVGRQRTLWSNPVFGKINDIIGTIPVPESLVKDKSIVVDTSINALKNGACIGIYPEGAILQRRKKFHGKTGAARMLLGAKTPIVPVGLLGTDGLWPYGAKAPKLGKHVKMYVGDPIWFEDYYDQKDDIIVIKYVTDIFMREIRKLSGWYNVPNNEIIKLYSHYENLVKPKS